MGSGKTRHGAVLARKLNLQFFDIDILFEQKYKINVYNFFNKYDEHLFRNLEHKLLREVIEEHDQFVLSRGGGTPCFHKNMDLVNQSGFSVYYSLKCLTIIFILIK